jgi:ATP-dependent DNA ligase
MLAARAESLPAGADWIFEPKWDGFRTIVFRDGASLLVQSRDERPLGRYFPELVAALRTQLPRRCVLDGEIVIARHGRLDFDALQLRLHPAASRVAMLAEETPASIVFFDLLALGATDYRDKPFAERHRALVKIAAKWKAPLHVTPATRRRATAADWFHRFEGAGLDGVVAKRASDVYESNRRVMIKVKHERDCDCVVAGFRWYRTGSKAVGSLLLGLHDDAGALQHVGVCDSFSAAMRRELVATLAPYQRDAAKGHPWLGTGRGTRATSDDGAPRRPGRESRWSAGKDLSWEPLRPELVVQVAYDHMQGARFRHPAQFRRWRPDKSPRECTYAQLEVVPPAELTRMFGR